MRIASNRFGLAPHAAYPPLAADGDQSGMAGAGRGVKGFEFTLA